jgi:hypothetical protein
LKPEIPHFPPLNDLYSVSRQTKLEKFTHRKSKNNRSLVGITTKEKEIQMTDERTCNFFIETSFSCLQFLSDFPRRNLLFFQLLRRHIIDTFFYFRPFIKNPDSSTQKRESYNDTR